MYMRKAANLAIIYALAVDKIEAAVEPGADEPLSV